MKIAARIVSLPPNTGTTKNGDASPVSIEPEAIGKGTVRAVRSIYSSLKNQAIGCEVFARLMHDQSSGLKK